MTVPRALAARALEGGQNVGPAARESPGLAERLLCGVKTLTVGRLPLQAECPRPHSCLAAELAE